MPTVPDQTARDAIEDVIADSPHWEGDDWALDFLAALGIPPEMSVDDVARAISTHVQTRAWQERVIAEQYDLDNAVNSDAAPEGAAPPATGYVGDQHTADQEPTDG